MRKLMSKTHNAKLRDPFILKHNGMYYHCFTKDCATISISCSETLEGLETAEEHVVFVPDKPEYSKQVWAPELHVIENKCFIYFAGDDGDNHNHRMYVLYNDSNNPLDTYRIHGKITDDSNRWAIDGTVFKYKEVYYYLWSGWEGFKDVRQSIYICKMVDPFTLTGERVLLTTPEYDWEKVGSTPEDQEYNPYVNEGPFCVDYNGEVYMAYSAAGSWCDGYCIAFMKLVGDNPLDVKCWKKYDNYTLRDNDLVKGAGHCCIIKDNDEYKVFFHGWSKNEERVIHSTVELWEGKLVIEEDNIQII